MEKEEIMAKSRLDNKKRDEMEQYVFYKSGQAACGAGALMCGIIMLLDAVFSDGKSMEIWAIFLVMTGTMLIFKYKKLKKISQLIFGISELIIAVIFLVIYAYQLIRG
ncbi:MAG: hypothetical protein IJ065_04025 [Eubacterium sp.]|nr:hypothetical protein [Eubacterium sp.]